VPQKPLPKSMPLRPGARAHVDLPVDQSSFFYNPLVAEWHAFRGRQVVDYLQFFSGVVRNTCLSDARVYTHQIVPFANPGWDQSKFAIDASLMELPGIRLGASLYGEATYGSSFSSWLESTTHKSYGITEFHPLKSMVGPDVRRMLARHKAQGADFISFFLEPRTADGPVPRNHNIFSLDPDNRRFSSDHLYRALKEAIGPAPAVPQSGTRPPNPAAVNSTP
jgi:hypothetical protein